MSELSHPPAPASGTRVLTPGGGKPSDTVPATAEPVSARLAGRIDRIVSGSREIAMDLMEMVDLKMQLLQVHLEERIEDRLNEVLQRALVAGIVLGGLFFLLVAAAFGLGTLLGHDALGFLAISVLLFLAALAIGHRNRQLVRFRLGSEEESQQEEESTSPEPNAVAGETKKE